MKYAFNVVGTIKWAPVFCSSMRNTSESSDEWKRMWLSTCIPASLWHWLAKPQSPSTCLFPASSMNQEEACPGCGGCWGLLLSLLINTHLMLDPHSFCMEWKSSMYNCVASQLTSYVQQLRLSLWVGESFFLRPVHVRVRTRWWGHSNAEPADASTTRDSLRVLWHPREEILMAWRAQVSFSWPHSQEVMELRSEPRFSLTQVPNLREWCLVIS